jgi:hypothetical protein
LFFQDRTLYSGQAVVVNLIDAGITKTCELKLDVQSWLEMQLDSNGFQVGRLSGEFKNFVSEWQKLFRVTSEFKLVVGDMQTFLSDLRLWLEQLELKLGLKSSHNS